MATSREYAEFVAECVACAGSVRYKKMFGEYMVYVNEKPLVLVCDETPFVKMLPCLEGLMGGAETGTPYKGAKEHYILDIEDSALTLAVLQELDGAIPLPARKTKKPPKTNEPDAIKKYIEAKEPSLRGLLFSVHETIGTALGKSLPDFTEKISWGMPTYWKKHNIIHFAAQKSHLGIYPGPKAIEHFSQRLEPFKTSKGAIRFPYKTFDGETLALIADIAEWCAANASAENTAD